MAIDNEEFFAPWTRRHDIPGAALIPIVPKILYPKSLEDLIEICATRIPHEYLKAAGSHWALSQAAISDDEFVETHDPNNVFRGFLRIPFPAMGRTLYDVVPGCLNRQFLDMLGSQHPRPYNDSHSSSDEGIYLVHFETGKRIYQLYSELDLGDDDNRQSLAHYIRRHYNNSDYLGPWAFQTLGGAGGQTVFGALTTGTHGGDFGPLTPGGDSRFPPIADSVMAMHLVVDGGKHYWIERESIPLGHRLTDDNALEALYGVARYGGPDNFQIIRDNDEFFNAVLVSAGRFGIVYSIVMRAVRQYSLHEERRLSIWEDIKSQVCDTSSPLYSHRFLQIGVSVTPSDNFQKHLCGITKRWNVPGPAGASVPNGRLERCGRVLERNNANIQGPLFEYAGNSHAYSGEDPSFLERACSNANFAEGVIQAVIDEVEDFATDPHTIAAGSIIATVATPSGVSGLIPLIPALLILLLLLKELLRHFIDEEEPRLGQWLNDLRVLLLERTDPDERAAGLFLWQMISNKIFETQQEDKDYEAISYAVMDAHDYFDKSCTVNVDSIEVFFDATSPMLVPFVDLLLAYEIAQEWNSGMAFAGYISLRFTGETKALIGMQRYPVTCAVEVAGLKDVSGSQELIDYAVSLALNRNFGGILHWGQRNESTMADIQHYFGDSLSMPGGKLGAWRKALSRVTQNGYFDRFSSEFTRKVGLEIVTPVIQDLKVLTINPLVGQSVAIAFDCNDNPPPPTTEIRLDITSPNIVPSIHIPSQLRDYHEFLAAEQGDYDVRLTAIIRLNGEERETSRRLIITVR